MMIFEDLHWIDPTSREVLDLTIEKITDLPVLLAATLAGDPLGSWIWRHIGPDELSPLQTQDDQPVEQFEPDRRNDEQIDAGDVGGVIAQESLPARRARAVTP